MKLLIMFSLVCVFVYFIVFQGTSSDNENTISSSSELDMAISEKIIIKNKETKSNISNTKMLVNTASLSKKLQNDAIYKAKLLNSTETEASKKEILENIDIDLVNAMEGLFKSSRDNDWESFLSLTDLLNVADVTTLNLALFKAISNNAPIEVIKKLLGLGAQFQPEVLTILALKNNVVLTKELIPLGLDIHGVDKQGRNGISQTLVIFDSRDMFDFFLNNGVSVNPRTLGVDPLDMALLKLLKENDSTLYYIETLIDYGASIGSSHKKLLLLLEQDNPSLYERLTVLAPRLI
jgi:hypothetical protein